MYVSERLGQWGTNIFSEHTSFARQAAKNAILDVVGCMTAGAGDEGTARVHDAVCDWGKGEPFELRV